MTGKVLITGGAGFIGSQAVKMFLERGYKVVVFDNFTTGFHDVLTELSALGELEVIEGDLRQKEEIAAAFAGGEIEGVLHFAALCSVNESMEYPERYFGNNVGGTINLLEAMSQAGVKKLIFSSTCAVYGESQYLPMDEKHPTQPLNPYGESKLISERMIEWYHQLAGLKYAVMRYFNVCGAASDGQIGDSKKPSVHLMQNAVRGAMGIEAFSYTCPVVDTPDGTPIRDYIDVEDLVAAHLAAYEKLEDEAVDGQVFNLSNGTGYSVREIVGKVEEIFGVEIEKTAPAKVREGEYASVFAVPAKAKELLGWQTEKSLTDSVESQKKWYSKRPQGWDK